MDKDQFRRSSPVFPISSAIRLTGLTARQIRYYEEQGLIEPQRSETNRRLYSLNDVDRLLDIIDLMDEGMTIKGIKNRYRFSDRVSKNSVPLTDQDVRRILRDELDFQSRFE